MFTVLSGNSFRILKDNDRNIFLELTNPQTQIAHTLKVESAYVKFWLGQVANVDIFADVNMLTRGVKSED